LRRQVGVVECAVAKFAIAVLSHAPKAAVGF
jgi:hypothetical protein